MDNCIVCPYHASRFDLEDGHVVNGPAVHPQPCLEVRTRDGQIEMRRLPPLIHDLQPAVTAEVKRKKHFSLVQKPAPIMHLRDQGILDPRREGADEGA